MSRINHTPEELSTAQDPRRVVLITGCSEGGIGYELAVALDSTSSYRVFATARNMEKMRTLPLTIERINMDVSDQESVDHAVEDVIRAAGRIDVLVNNAGVNTGVGPAVEVSVDRYTQTYDVNVFGLLRVTQAVAKHMIPYARQQGTAKAGMIVNIGSIVGYLALPYSAAYNSSKAAAHSISDAMRLELEPFGIKVIVVAPGKIKSHFGDKGESDIDTPPDGGNYAHVLDQVRARAQISQVGNSMPARIFVKQVVKHMEQHGSLGDGKSLGRKGAYLTVGPASSMAWTCWYLPPFLKDALIKRVFKLSKIGHFPSQQSKKLN
ncbi:NAD(P)-binding protein [Tilletiaria anomala UBC 951]|uniref:NAD(P)-binding protein n=1 Tax=Tilletiaria anomala (strain ATCC 24038 / CBS 436.72 / UBC 951) TaxID=1037660 RepID=A0A066VB54_TILAU|nr:NAD(P)-binding protein [Tilletiaria anomala UBC 951]KDN37528.1 NAD(P)-binding protein [Tilletiaria anomala UBC 951]